MSAGYTIIETKWGFFGLAADSGRVLKTILPTQKRLIESYFKGLAYNANCHKSLQKLILHYFDGMAVEFGNIDVQLEGLGVFEMKVLNACRAVSYGNTISYKQLAGRAGNPKAFRAAANALAKNPIPLIIPCHRIICSDGKIGGFSAGTKNLKQQMIELEKR